MRVTVVTATGLEAAAVRKAIPNGARVVQAGIALRRARDFGESAISCGIAGGLRDDLPTGSVLVPRRVRCPDGSIISCDEDFVDALARAARSLGYDPIGDPLLTSATLVRGRERAYWAARGFAGVDMETGIMQAQRIACVRVVLDTPGREISAAWQYPASVPFHPRAWLDVPFLAREGPRCARVAARIAAEALRAMSI